MKGTCSSLNTDLYNSLIKFSVIFLQRAAIIVVVFIVIIIITPDSF